MKTTQNTVIVSEITTSDGKVFNAKDQEKQARAHERNLLAQRILAKHGLNFGTEKETVMDWTVLSAVLKSFDDLVEAFHEESVMTPGYGTRDDF